MVKFDQNQITDVSEPVHALVAGPYYHYQCPVMLSLETVSCLKTVLRQFVGVLVLRIGVLVLVLVLRVAAINQDNFNPDNRPNIYAEQKYLALRPLIAKLFCIPTTSAPVEQVFSQGGIMQPHRAKMGNDVLEMLMHQCCNGN